MGLLTPAEVHRMRLATGRLYEAICDDADCSKLLLAGSLYVHIKSKNSRGKVSKGVGASGSKPIKVRCLECEDKCRGIDREKMREKAAKKEGLIPLVRTGILKIYRKDPKPRTSEEIIFRLHRKAKYQKFKKNQIKRTLRAMKKQKELKRTKGKWTLISDKEHKK